MLLVPVFLRNAELTWFIDAVLEAVFWVFGSLFLAGKVAHLLAFPDWGAKITFLVFLLFYLPYAIASILKFGMTPLPRFIGKVNLVPIDGAPLTVDHVRRFLFALVCENLFVIFTGGIGFLFLIYGKRKHGSPWHSRKSLTRIAWVVVGGPGPYTYGGPIFQNRHVHLPRSSLGKWIRKIFPPKGR